VINEQAIQDVIERVRSRFYGKYRGTVTLVDDATMRVKANVPAVLGTQESGWAMACVPYAGPQVGIAFLPEVGSGVWIEFEGGDVSFPIWTGCFWYSGQIPGEAKADVKAIVTQGKNKFVLDDSTPSITVTDNNNNTVKLDSNGVTLAQQSMKVVVGTANVNVNDGSLEVT